MSTTLQNLSDVREEFVKKAFDAKKQLQDTAEEYKHDVEKKIKTLQDDVRKFSFDQAELVLSALKTQKWIKESKAFQAIESKVPFKVHTETFEEFKKRQLLKDLAENILQRAKQISETLIKDPIGSVKNIREVVLAATAAVPKKAKVAVKKTKKTAKKAVKKAKKSPVH